MVRLQDMDAYYVEPEAPSDKAIVVNYDVMGIDGGRLRSVSDQLAKDTGFHVIMPDFFRNGEGINDYRTQF